MIITQCIVVGVSASRTAELEMLREETKDRICGATTAGEPLQ